MNINPISNYNSKDCKHPSFQMALKMDKNVISTIKEQALKLNPNKYDSFWKQIDDTVERQKENPVNIILRKSRGRNAITAVVVDENAETAIKNKKFSQGIFSKNGSLKFLEESENCANKINEMNNKIEGYEKAVKSDYKPSSIKNVEREEIVEINN